MTSQDQRRGGPDPAICKPGYTAKINGNVLDLQGHHDFVAAVYAAFPDLNHIIEDTVADEEKVAVRFILEGTHRADFMGIAPTGKRIHVEGIGILQIEDGKVAELRGVFDQASMMQQLGAG
jgi:steroid delta-isomerase-like uncharacterized protein